MFEFTALSAYKLLFMLELLVAEFLYMFRLKRRSRFYLRCAAAVTASFVLAFLFPVIFFNAIYSSLMFLCLFFVTVAALAFCFDEPFINIVFCGIAAYTTRHLAFQFYSLISSAGQMGINTIFGSGEANILNDLYSDTVVDANILSLESLFWALIYIAAYIISYALLFLLFGRQLWRNDDLKIKNTSFLMLVGFVLLIDIFLNAALVYITEDYNEIYSIIMYVYNILCCVLTLYMQFSMISMKKLKKELSIISHMWQQEREQYELAKENIDLINLKCHDLKHQIRQIGRQGSLRKKSIYEIENLISIYDSAVRTGNEALDVILTEKSLICKKKRISLTCMADGGKLSFMEESDIYSLFGNIIDNAIEAVTKLEDPEKRIIGLSVHAADNIIAVNVNNYYEGEITMSKDDGLPVTTKRNKDYHGFGMKSIRMLVEKYDGDLTVTAKKGVFNINLILPSAGKIVKKTVNE